MDLGKKNKIETRKKAHGNSPEDSPVVEKKKEEQDSHVRNQQRNLSTALRRLIHESGYEADTEKGS